MRGKFLLVFLLLFSTKIFAVESGWYGNLIVGFDKSTNLLTGYYESEAGELTAPAASCQFYFYGNLIGSSANIKIVTALANGNIFEGNGLVVSNDTKRTLTVKIKEALPSCARYEDFFSESPSPLVFDSKGEWIKVGYVKSKKAYFFDDKELLIKKKSYITTGDPVYIYKEDESSVMAEYISKKGKSTKGWLDKKYFYSDR